MPKVGDKVWIGHGMRIGQDVDNADSQPFETEREALNAIKNEWFTFLPDLERRNAAVYARVYEVIEIDEDGKIAKMVTVDHKDNPNQREQFLRLADLASQLERDFVPQVASATDRRILDALALIADVRHLVENQPKPDHYSEYIL